MTDERDQAIQAAYRFLRDDGALRRTLRRIEDPTEALYHEGTHTALDHLRRANMADRDRALDALLLLSHVDTDVPGRLGHQLRAVVQPARFRRLADADRQDTLRTLRYMVQQCKGRVSTVDLAWTAYRWGQPKRDGGTTAKERLALDYYSPQRPKKEESE